MEKELSENQAVLTDVLIEEIRRRDKYFSQTLSSLSRCQEIANAALEKIRDKLKHKQKSLFRLLKGGYTDTVDIDSFREKSFHSAVVLHNQITILLAAVRVLKDEMELKYRGPNEEACWDEIQGGISKAFEALDKKSKK